MIGCHPAGGQEQRGMPTETAVYSGWLTNHLRCCWAQRATESRFSLLDQATPRNTAEVEEKQLAQSTRAIQANQLLYSKQCWLCQEIATAQQEPVEKPALFYSFQLLVPMTLRHHSKKGGGGEVKYKNQHQPTHVMHPRQLPLRDDTSWSWLFCSPALLPRSWAPRMHLNLTYWYISSELSQQRTRAETSSISTVLLGQFSSQFRRAVHPRSQLELPSWSGCSQLYKSLKAATPGSSRARNKEILSLGRNGGGGHQQITIFLTPHPALFTSSIFHKISGNHLKALCKHTQSSKEPATSTRTEISKAIGQKAAGCIDAKPAWLRPAGLW